MAESSSLLEGHDSNVKQPMPSVSSGDATFSLLGARDFPMVEVELQPDCSICAEPGRMIQLPEGVKFHTVLGDGTEAGFMTNIGKAASRMFSGENFVLARFTNDTEEPKILRFGTVVPGHLIPINLADYGGCIIGMSGVYFLGSDALKVEMCFKQTLGSAFFGGESFILQKIHGEGAVLLQAGGCVLKEELTPQRPMLKVDTGCLVGFTQECLYEVMPAGGLKSWIFGGEGIFFAVIRLAPRQSKGIVWIESFPYSKFISKIKASYNH